MNTSDIETKSITSLDFKLDDNSRVEMRKEIDNMLWKMVDSCIKESCTFRKDIHRSEMNFVLKCLFKAATEIVNINLITMNDQFMKKEMKQYLGPTPLPKPNVSNFSVYIEPDDDEYYDIEDDEEQN